MIQIIPDLFIGRVVTLTLDLATLSPSQQQQPLPE